MNTATQAASLLESKADDQAIAYALHILTTRLHSHPVFTHPHTVQHFLRLQSQGLPHEVFACMYLDAQSRLIGYERLFRGTLTRISVYPREVVKQALAMNAASVILHHNHPSGQCQPSAADVALTHCLQAALALVDVLVLDHVVTSDAGALSMAEQGVLSFRRPCRQP